MSTFDWLWERVDVLWVNSHCWVNCTNFLPVNCSLLSETKQAGIAGLVEKPHCFICDGCSDTVRQIAYFAESRVTAYNTEVVKEVISQNICFCFVLWSVGCTVRGYYILLLFSLFFTALMKAGDNHESYWRS